MLQTAACSKLANVAGILYDSDMIDKNTESDPQRPRKRWRKTKWFYGIVLLYFAITIAAGVLWSAYSHEKFNEAVDPVLARGEPLVWSDFATEPVPDDQNGVILYESIMEGYVLQDPNCEFDNDAEPWSWGRYEIASRFIGHRGIRRKHAEELRKLLDMANRAFATCREARHLGKFDWRIDFNGKAAEFPIPPIQRFVRVANLLHLAAIEAHEAGRDDDAIEYYLDGVALGDSMFKIPIMTSYLVGVAIHAVMDSSLEAILPTMKIGDEPRAVSPDKLRGLIARLLDTSRCTEGLTRAIMGERSVRYDICQSLLKGKIPSDQLTPDEPEEYLTQGAGSSRVAKAGFDFFLAPLLRIDAAWLVKHDDAHVAAAEAATLPQSRRAFGPAARDRDERLARMWISRPISEMLLGDCDRVFELHHRFLAGRQMAWAAIAIRLHQVDRGSRPIKLDDLVPDYLPEVPQDPMDEPGRKIRYVNDSDMPRLYSVGCDGRDDSGVYDDLYRSGTDNKEILFFLTGRPERTKEQSDALYRDN